MPPKPKLLDITVSMWRWRAVRGTRSMTLARLGSCRLRVGGATPSRIAMMEKMASTAPAAPSRCPIADLVDDMERL